MTKTFKELDEINKIIAEIFAKRPGIEDTKFGYFCKKFAKESLSFVFKEYNDQLVIIRVDHALTDKNTGALIKNPDKDDRREYSYDKKGFKDLIVAEGNLYKEYENKEYEIKPFICKPEDVPKKLNEYQTEVLTGVLI